MCIYRNTPLVLLRMRNVSDKRSRENQNTHFMCYNFFLKIVTFTRWCGKIWYSRTGHRGQYNTAHVHCMLVNNATDSHSEYVKLTAFPRQKWLRESASVLCLYLVVRVVTSVLQMVKYYITTTYDMIARSHSLCTTDWSTCSDTSARISTVACLLHWSRTCIA